MSYVNNKEVKGLGVFSTDHYQTPKAAADSGAIYEFELGDGKADTHRNLIAGALVGGECLCYMAPLAFCVRFSSGEWLEIKPEDLHDRKYKIMDDVLAEFGLMRVG
jgi:hypothetical protein